MEFPVQGGFNMGAPACHDSLTPTEVTHLNLVAQGLTARQAAQERFVSEATVRTHLRNILTKMDANNLPHAVAKAFSSGILPLPEDD